ncbi:MAG: GNAT family N-acetyltransferase [Bryobacterales bacterium]|nr:GNAT family N-acetyltransferase [Bryobacterales bacterium]
MSFAALLSTARKKSASGRTTLSGHVSFEIVTKAARLKELKPEWDALWNRCRNGGVFQSFDCCLTVWQAIAEPAGHKLFCIVGWDGLRMVAVWPCTTYRKLALRFAVPLLPTGGEYIDILIDETVDQQGWIKGAWHRLRTEFNFDLVILPNLRTGTDLSQLFYFCMEKAAIYSDVGAYAHLRREKDWQSYYESLSDSPRRELASKRRQLAKLGTVEFEILEAGDPRCSEIIGWMLSQKRVWAERTNKKGHWLFSEGYRQYLTRLLADSVATPKRAIMCLTLEGVPIAAKIVAIGKDTLELIIGGFDARYRKYSPGMRLDEHWVKWALERKLDCDFGAGREHYKSFWSRNNVIRMNTYWIPMSWRGAVALQLRGGLHGTRSRYRTLRMRWRSRSAAPFRDTVTLPATLSSDRPARRDAQALETRRKRSRPEEPK